MVGKVGGVGLREGQNRHSRPGGYDRGSRLHYRRSLCGGQVGLTRQAQRWEGQISDRGPGAEPENREIARKGPRRPSNGLEENGVSGEPGKARRP